MDSLSCGENGLTYGDVGHCGAPLLPCVWPVYGDRASKYWPCGFGEGIWIRTRGRFIVNGAKRFAVGVGVGVFDGADIVYSF